MARCQQHRKAAAKDDILQALLWASAYFRRPLTDPLIRGLTREQILLHDDMRRKLERLKAGLSPDEEGETIVDASFDNAMNQSAITVSARSGEPVTPDKSEFNDPAKWKDV